MSDTAAIVESEVITAAHRLGLVPFIAQPFELFLDIDNDMTSEIPSKKFVGPLYANRAGWQIIGKCMTRSKSGDGRHCYLRLDRDVTPQQRCALQAMLGSDPVRELLGLALIPSNGVSALFETPEAAVEVERWRAQYVELAELPF